MSNKSGAAAIHSRLKHPVIDSDGHWIEFEPAALDYVKKVGGDSLVARFTTRTSHFGNRGWSKLTPEERGDRRMLQPPWWALPTKNTRDRATAMLPRLLYERMDEIGLDFAVLYPTNIALFAPFQRDDEVRRATCRACNMFIADLFGEFKDRIAPAGVIPMHTPEEAIEELEFAVKTLGLKSVMLSSLVRRPVKAAQKEGSFNRYAVWTDTLGLDSPCDYDAVWAKCVELKINPTFHSASSGLGFRTSPSNFVYNHIGHFGAAGEAVCKSLFLAGVTRRFPTLKFAFLEGGVGWGCTLYSDLIGHWKKRNLKAVEATNPANLDFAALAEMVKHYGADGYKAHIDELQSINRGQSVPGAPLDDFGPCKIEKPQDIRDLFVNNFYFGCESDDPANAWAFNRKVNPYGARLNAIFGSDIGHFDVPDMTDVLPEAYELVDDGLITEEDFRDFVFGNPARFWGGTNPNFFKGTVVEKQVASLLADESAHPHPAAAS